MEGLRSRGADGEIVECTERSEWRDYGGRGAGANGGRERGGTNEGKEREGANEGKEGTVRGSTGLNERKVANGSQGVPLKNRRSRK